MGQILVKNYIHIIFSTNYRQPLISEQIESELFAYMGGICNNLKCQPVSIGGFRDHVHVLCLLSKKVPLMKLMEEMKSHSSKWIKSKGEEFNSFYGQNGYGAFSVYSKDIDTLISYIKSQKEHHTKVTFQEEFRSLMLEQGLDFDEKYVWE